MMVTVLIVLAAWAISAISVWYLLVRYSSIGSDEVLCCCKKFTLDGGDPLVTEVAIHEVKRCQPRREVIR
jgi:hypothetical protein